MALKKNELYLYCFYPNNRCHDAKEKDLKVNKEDHCMTQHIVKKEDIPDNLADYTYDGSKFEKIKDIEEERELFSLRQERNRLISETDWWASADLTMTTEQKKYRQDLRDITKKYKSLTDVVFPIKPTG